MSILKDLVLRESLELLMDVTELQVDAQEGKKVKKCLDNLAHSLANMIEVLNEEN